jgi:hypothetical protein
VALAGERVMRRGLITTVAAVMSIAVADDARGQSARWRPVVRADLFAAEVDAAHAGAGVVTDLGSYVRLDAVLGAGAARAAGRTFASARGDVIGRFVIDPLRQQRWGPYVGAGLIARLDDDGPIRGLVALVIGTELPGGARWVPAVELGFGGGVRLGFVLRAGRAGRR